MINLMTGIDRIRDRWVWTCRDIEKIEQRIGREGCLLNNGDTTIKPTIPASGSDAIVVKVHAYSKL